MVKVALVRSVMVTVARTSRRFPRKSWTSSREKGVDSDGVAVYSPGRIKKKNAMQIMSAIARVPSLVPM